MENSFTVYGSITCLLCLLIYQLFFRSAARRNLPPSPKPWPIIGNMMDLPPKDGPEWMHWLKHKDLYGPISSVTVMNTTLILIHSREAAHYILEKHSLQTSARPRMEFLHGLCDFGQLMSIQPYDACFRRRRKFSHQHLGTKVASARYNDIYDTESRWLLLQLLKNPQQDLMKLFRTETGAIILKSTYGYSIERNQADPLVDLIETMLTNVTQAAEPLRWLVDTFPLLRYLPDSFPGAGFKKKAREYKQVNLKVADIPYAFVKQKMADPTSQPSYLSNLLQQLGYSASEKIELSRVDEDDAKWTAATLYAGATDSTSVSLTSFILAMAMYPEAQRKAQEEIDRVTKGERLPRFEDEEELPYVKALVKEVYRWHPTLPMSFPHMVDEDVMYDGYLIPKGAYILLAIQWLLHDPDVYADPDAFCPDRYLEPRNEPSPDPMAFGSGRRICPGRAFAHSMVFITVAQILAVFDIGKAIDVDGQQMGTKPEGTPGIISKPKQFPCSIKPRSAKHEDLIRQSEKEKPWGKPDSRHLDWSIHSD